MELKQIYGEILTEHNMNPNNKRSIENPTIELRGVNPSCGDDIVLYLKLDQDEKIVEASFDGDGCAISQASSDIMCDLIIGKKKDEALRLSEIFLRMIRGKITEEEKEELEEAGILEDISHMPARVKCAVLAWRTMDEIFQDATEGKIDRYSGKFD